jgi:hypothetical protein
MRRVVVGCRREKTVCCKGAQSSTGCKGAESSTKPHSQEDKNQLKGNSSALSLPFSIKGNSSAVSLQPFMPSTLTLTFMLP